MKRWALWAATLAVGGAVTAGAVEARACGGCFAPPGAVQVVTDHRMALSISTERTVLWDQFRYSGRPDEFSWILPIRNGPEVRIELADNGFLTALDNLTAPVLNRPTPPRTSCPRYDDFEADARATGGAGQNAPPSAAADAGVVVLQEQVVGPYQTVVLRGEDPMALRDWLRANGYSVPQAIEPIVDHYVGLRMDFIALRLRPGEGIDRMSPVRVTTPGASPTLPLRMIAAGVADKVGLLLTVIASARWEAMNFPNGEVRHEDLVYDWSAPTSPAEDFTRQFDRLNRASGQRLWLTEASLPMARSTVELATQVSSRGPNRPMGVVTDDAQLAFQGLGSTATITRLRAELGPNALDQDLVLAASDLGMRDRTYRYGRELNRRPDVVCFNPSDGSSANGIGCSATPSRAGGGLGAVLAMAGIAGVVVARRRRR